MLIITLFCSAFIFLSCARYDARCACVGTIVGCAVSICSTAVCLTSGGGDGGGKPGGATSSTFATWDNVFALGVLGYASVLGCISNPVVEVLYHSRGTMQSGLSPLFDSALVLASTNSSCVAACGLSLFDFFFRFF